MPKIDIIECKTKDMTSAFLFVPAMVSESITTRNISVFEELNVNQIGLVKDSLCFNELFYIWWGYLNIEIQMLNMQNYELGMNRPYNLYQHLFSGLVLWHLCFNYIKMV